MCFFLKNLSTERNDWSKGFLLFAQRACGRVRKGEGRDVPSAGAERDLDSRPQRWALSFCTVERGMATSASPATAAVLLKVLVISWF